MALIGSTGTIYRGNNSVSHFANLTPIKKQEASSWKIIGILRIMGIVLEIGLSLLMPKLAPLFIIAGGGFQQALDTYQYIGDEKNSGRNISFALSSAVNLVPMGFVVRSGLKASKNVLKIIDPREVSGFRYVVRGIDKDYNQVFKNFDKGLDIKKLFQAQKVSLTERNRLLGANIIPKYWKQTKKNVFEVTLADTFSGLLGDGSKNYGQRLITNNSSVFFPNQSIFKNVHLASIRHAVRQVKRGKNIDIIYNQLIKNLKKNAWSPGYPLNEPWKYSAYPGFERKPIYKIIKEQVLPSDFKNTLKGLAKIYKQIKIDPSKVISKGILGKIRNSLVKAGGRKFRGITQSVQLTNANDAARELLNRPVGALLSGRLDLYSKTFNVFGNKFAKLGGLRGWARKINQSLFNKMPRIKKILSFANTRYKRLVIIKKGLRENGIMTRDDIFLLGWRVIKKGSMYSNIIFYFNPVTTHAKTHGSLNYGGKKAFSTTLRNGHLKHLANTETPGHAYLKGEGGWMPIAINPGGRRPATYLFMSKAFELFALYIPLTGLRNVLSVVSNFKNVFKDMAQGTYLKKWGGTFRNTLRRLWINKITRILGHTVGGLISQEMGMHFGRILKTVGQGFQTTKTTTKIIGGKKIIDRKTTFSFSNNFKSSALLRQGLPLTIKSVSLRRTKKTSPIRSKLRNKRYGTNLRRIPGLFYRK